MKGIADWRLPISDWRIAGKTGVAGGLSEGQSRLQNEQSAIGNWK